jgi:hypothetical protein
VPVAWDHVKLLIAESVQPVGHERPTPLAHRLGLTPTCVDTEPAERGGPPGPVSAQAGTIRDRRANACGVDWPRTHAPSVSRS